ncbi:glutathione S-transferase family protein [Wenzhouxiangella limi]|uniref:Glutathione S-transferase family protein n=1 Tax=Wenzhouxiangella limi TaxID=2707351 RepID=A0A845UUF1_9GAMM|nr:glutathione S-transferase family protein [Wenzhouxiangella limi]NDY95453.1 glutathione S-transferase family protein [Wenzhouxiangella limi]
MKLYTYPDAPSPRRVQLFLAEKGLDIPRQTIDLRAGEHLRPEFAAINPALTVPALVLDDGTCLVEPIAICDYLEQVHPEPALFGRSPLERAMVLERNHWIETNGLLAVMEGFRNRSKAMSDRALTGPRRVSQIPELAERGVQRYGWFLEDLDRRLADSDYVAGDRFSLADITAWVTLEFAAWGIRTNLPETLTSLQRWHRQLASRPAFARRD